MQVFHRKLVSKVVLWGGLFMSVPLIVHPPIQRVAILRMWISQVEIGASVLDVYETFVVQMKDILSIHCVFQWTWIPRVWKVIAIVRRKCYRDDVWARGVALRLVSFSVLFWSSCGSRCTFPVDVGCFLKGEHGVWLTLSAESACKMFVLLGMVNHSAWFEGCFISQRFYCRIMAASVLSRKRLSCTRGNVISKGTCWICLAIRFHSQCCARVCVDSECWRTQFFGSPLNWVGFVFGFWFCWVPTKVFSVLIVNDGDSEIVSFFGRASFVLYLRSVEDRMCA